VIESNGGGSESIAMSSQLNSQPITHPARLHRKVVIVAAGSSDTASTLRTWHQTTADKSLTVFSMTTMIVAQIKTKTKGGVVTAMMIWI